MIKKKKNTDWARVDGFAFEEWRCLMTSFSIVTDMHNTVLPDSFHQHCWLQSFCPFLP